MQNNYLWFLIYLFFIIIGILVFGFFIGTNWIRTVIELNQCVSSGFDPIYIAADRPDPATLLSKTLMLDVCPMTCFVIHIGCIFDRKRTFTRVIAPVCLFGALLTMGGGLTDPAYHAEWSWYFIFVGFDMEKGYFIVHFMNIMTSTWVLLNTPKAGVKKFPLTVVAMAIFFAYVGLCIGISHSITPNPGPDDHNNLWIYQNVAGVLLYDWTLIGEFRAVLEVLGPENVNVPAAMYIGYIVFTAVIVLFCFAQNLFQLSKVWYIPDKYKTKKNWLLN